MTRSKYSDKIKPKRRINIVQILERKKEYLANAYLRGLTMKEYFQRVSDKVLLEHLESKGAVLIEGAKWCGKTTSAKHIARSVIEIIPEH